jgi:thymidylate kinase
MGLSRLIESGRALRVTEKKETLYIVNKKYSEMVNKYGFVVLDGTRDPKNLVDEILHIIMGK